MEPSQWISLAGLVTTTLIAILSLSINSRNHRKEIERMERYLEIERAHKPHIEFCLDANFFGPQQGEVVAEFLIEVKNKGKIQQKITSLKLRVRGIREGDNLEFMEKYPTRLKFPEKLLQTQVIDKDFGYYFIEPDVNQVISFTTKIPENYRFVLVWAEFRYGDTRQRGEGARHSAERVFEVKPQGTG